MGVKLAAAVLALLAAVACGGEPAKEGTAPRTVDAAVAPVEETDWPSTFEAGGVVRAALGVTVSSRIVAPVLAVHVNAGDRIRRGQPLVTLDAREPRANAERATAALAAARETSAASESNIPALEAALTLARASHDRVRALHDTRSATPQELDEAVAALDGATARLRSARAQAAAAAAALAAARADADAAQVGLSYAVLTAPFDGVVSSRSADPGMMAMPGVELLSVESAGRRTLDVQVDDSRRNWLEPGDEAEVRLDAAAAPEAWTKTRISEIARVDPRQHSFLVKLELPAASAVHSGAFGRARLFGPSRRALTAPASALVRRGQLWFAFAVDRQNVARLRVLTPGDARGGRVEILSGAAAGDRLVLDPSPSLEDGVQVRATAATADRRGPAGAPR